MNHRIEPISFHDFDQVIQLWRNTEGVGLNESDSRQGIARYLTHNRGMSFVVRDGNMIIAAVLCGHDGRRGYLNHLTVAKAYLRQGLGNKLVAACLTQLERAGVLKCNIFLYANNAEAEVFWKQQGWNVRVDLLLMQKPTGHSFPAQDQSSVR